MTLRKRLCAGVLALVCAASFAASATAAPPRPLSTADARAYGQAFEAADAGDFLGAQLKLTEISDGSLGGYLSYSQLMHPTAHTASFEELSSWLVRFRDLPLADRIFSIATKRKPPEAPAPPIPDIAVLNGARSEVTFPARDAFYSGQVKRAFDLAVKVGERWIAGLSAYRLGDYAQAQDYFSQVARDDAEDAWLRSAAAFWAARSATVLGDTLGARTFLQLAAQSPQTFYGMIAGRQVQLASAETGQLTLAAYQAPAPAPPKDDVADFVASNARAHRAAALAQIGRIDDARQELRAGQALARTSQERRQWEALIAALASGAGAGYQVLGYSSLGQYPTLPLEPRDGFTIDKALVYAIVRQESAFNPKAVSPVGAIGLMQLMPETAALVTGNDKLKRNHKPLFDPALNLRAGQDYLTWLMDKGVGGDLLRVVAAYNGGPGAVLKAVAQVGENDPLMLIESLPALETRDYVEKVVAAYWTYKRAFGEEVRSLDALAGGARMVDVRLDLADPVGPQPEAPAQDMQIGAL